jgi:hypothetical protein
MRDSEVEQRNRDAIDGPQVRHSPLDLALEIEKKRLTENGFPQRVIDQMDHYTRFERIEPHRLSRSHRWTREDVGKTFVGFEVPVNSSEGIVFEVILTCVFGKSIVSFEVSEAYDLTRLENQDWSVWHLGPFSEFSYFEINAEKPMTWEFAERACAMLDSNEAHDRFRLFMAIQDWALQPSKGYLQ